MSTTIQWTDETWNPVTGCTKVSEGCRNCYIERTVPFRSKGRKFVNGTTGVMLHPDRLAQPLHWKKPRKIFLSLSDLFHEDVPDAFIGQVFTTMANAHWQRGHIFQILTKRPARMKKVMEKIGRGTAEQAAGKMNEDGSRTIQVHFTFPLRGIWLGVSCEDQQTADERIPLLLQTPAAVRFISAEPLLGPIDLTHLDADGSGHKDWCQINALTRRNTDMGRPCPDIPTRLDLVICGGESGTNARPCDLAWIRSIVQQCREAGVACFVKQLGAVPIVAEHEWKHGNGTNGITGHLLNASNRDRTPEGFVPLKYQDKKGGDIAEWPEDLRIREFPS